MLSPLSPLSPLSFVRSNLSIQKDSRKVHEGYLYKKRTITIYNEWQRRYFVLYDDRTVDFYKNAQHSSSRKNAEGTIHLTQIKRVEFVYCKSNKNHAQRPKTAQQQQRPRSISLCSVIEPFFLKSNRKQTYIPTKPFRSQTMSAFEYADNDSNALSTKANVVKPQNYKINGWSLSDTITSSMANNKEDVRANIGSFAFDSRRSLSPLSEEDTEWELSPYYKNMTPRKISNVSKNTLYSIDSSIYKSAQPEENEEDNVFNDVLRDTELGLETYRNNSFALVSSSRDWILSAENAEDAKDWVMQCHKLCQGKNVHDGYMNGKYYVLHANKVLNCHDEKYQIEQDIDLRDCLFIKYDESLNANEISLGMRANDKKKQNICLKADNRHSAKQWFKQIKSLFGDNESFKKLHHSKCQNINITHNQSQLKNRFIAMYREYLVIFPNAKQFDSITKMTFFNKQIFGDMLRREKCILIPLQGTTRIRKASRAHGKYAFVISDVEGDRKWYFTLSSGAILSNWMNKLCAKYKSVKSKRKKKTKEPKTSVDLEIESSLSPHKIPSSPTKKLPSEINKLFKYHILSSSYSESLNHLTILLTNDQTQIIA